MKLIVYTTPDKFHSEIEPIIEMFREGLEVLHVRKPKFSAKDLDEYLELIPKKYHNRIILHTHHKLAKKHRLKGVHITSAHRKKKYSSNYKLSLLRFKHPTWTISRSCHRTHSIMELPNKFNYVFLSPIYDSISKESHGGNFSFRSIKLTLVKSTINVYALGGVDESKFEEISELGFSGVALLGAIWNSDKKPVEAFISARNKLEEMALESA